MRKPDFCPCQNKDADQLCSNCAADQHLCFHYSCQRIEGEVLYTFFEGMLLFDYVH